MMVRFIGCIVISAALLSLIIADDPCRFESGGKVIDISSLANTNGKAAFPDEVPETAPNYQYSYNPCKPFTEGTDCNNVAACQVSTDGQFTFAIGTQDSAKWDPGNGADINPSIAYSSGEKQVSVELVCTDSTPGDLEAVGENPQNFYKFRLHSKCSCWNGCQGGVLPPAKNPPSVSVGTVFIIIVAASPVLYLSVFAVYNGVHHHRRGLDLIAHRTFWVTVLGCAKDGVRYLFRRATGRGGLDYQSV